jgi:hypothetical protein
LQALLHARGHLLDEGVNVLDENVVNRTEEEVNPKLVGLLWRLLDSMANAALDDKIGRKILGK